MITQPELDRLDIILNKKPIIGTWLAQDLIERPEMVRENYLEHVRSFVALNRIDATTQDDQPTVEEYEKRLLKLVREGGAAKGFIVAEYGYGKTSTALFVWQRCEQANLVAVPPFQIQQLHHLITATYGWVRYKLGVNYPTLVADADAIYQKYVNRDLEAHGENEEQRRALRKAYDEGRYTLELRPLDYIRYFEEMTALVKRANFDGLVIIADELQQYVEPDIKAGLKDPLTPLFEIIQALMTRRGQLAFALIFSVPTKELGVINENRGDLVQRLKSDRLALDLNVTYNQNFAGQLWQHLAEELGFENLINRIVQPQTLEALGQISARTDLAVGPRTVIDVFNLMTRRYKERGGQVEPFSPLDLVNAFLNNEISYDQTAKLQQVVNSQLAHQFVQGRPDYQKAIKLMAAFPIDGLRESYFKLYGVQEAISGLTEEARGDIVLWLGGGVDETGQRRDQRAMLVGLEERKASTEWLPTTLREFVRNIPERSARMRDLAVKGFQQLLRLEIFKSGQWSLERSLEASMTQNRAYLFRGSFGTTARRYPQRLLHVRIINDGETVRDRTFDGDLALNFELNLFDQVIEQERRYLPGELSFPGELEKTTRLVLNLSHNSGKESYGDLHNTLNPLVSPWKITPLLLLSLYAYLDEKRGLGNIPLIEDEFIKNNFQPILLEHAFNELFTPELGQQFQAAGARIVEEVVRRQLEQHYSQYRTFMSNSQWKQNLREYIKALSDLPTPFIRQGQESYDKSKQDLAKLFAKTVPAWESYQSNNPTLLKAESGGWRFTLHPLENQLMGQLKSSLLTPKPPLRRGEKPRNWIKRDTALRAAMLGGYREEEFETAISLLEARGMVSLSPNRAEIIEEVAKIPAIAELRETFNYYTDRLHLIKAALPDNAQLVDGFNELGNYRPILDHLKDHPDEARQVGLATTLKNRLKTLDAIVETERKRLEKGLADIVKEGITRPLNIIALKQELLPGLFSNQLEAQRNTLSKETDNAASTIAPLEQKIIELISLAGQTPLPDSDLLQLIEEDKRLRDSRFRQQQVQAKLQQLLAHYDQARKLLAEGQRFEQRLQSVPTNLQEQFTPHLQEWNLSITSDLSSQKLAGLARQSEWREVFEGFYSRFEAALGAQREQFTAIQGDYRSFITHSFPHVTPWPLIVYNQAEPQDSYNRLWESLHEVFKQAIEGIRQQVQAVYDRAARLQGGGIATLQPEKRQVVQANLNTQLTKLTEYKDNTNNWVLQVANPRFIEPVRSKGATKPAETMLKPVLTNLRKLTENLPQASQVIAEVEKEIKDGTLTPQEEAVLQVLGQLSLEGKFDSIELGLLLQHLNPPGEGSSGNTEGFKWPWDNSSNGANLSANNWKLLSQLYAKGRLSIRIAPVAFKEAPSTEF